eukprot:COSAG01_NODE_2859_length_6958_cov_21.603994_2_plen_337_part_00
MQRAGYHERALGLLQAAVEFNCFMPPELAGAEPATQRRFLGAFWDSDAPRLGDGAALGWASWLREAQSALQQQQQQQQQQQRQHAAAAAAAATQRGDTGQPLLLARPPGLTAGPAVPQPPGREEAVDEDEALTEFVRRQVAAAAAVPDGRPEEEAEGPWMMGYEESTGEEGGGRGDTGVAAPSAAAAMTAMPSRVSADERQPGEERDRAEAEARRGEWDASEDEEMEEDETRSPDRATRLEAEAAAAAEEIASAAAEDKRRLLAWAAQEAASSRRHWRPRTAAAAADSGGGGDDDGDEADVEAVRRALCSRGRPGVRGGGGGEGCAASLCRRAVGM